MDFKLSKNRVCVVALLCVLNIIKFSNLDFLDMNTDNQKENIEDQLKVGDVSVRERTEEAEAKKKSLGKKESGGTTSFFIELVKVVVIAFIIIIPIRTFVFQPFFVQGASMEPNFHNAEYLIINELGYKKTVVAAGEKEILAVKPFKDLQRGTSVVFRYPNDPSKFFIKRIVGLPGEKIVIKNNKVKIYNDEYPDGFILDESSYLPNHVKTNKGKEFNLRNDEYVVLGDNRTHSSDSRDWGILPADFIVGKVLLRAWPINKFELF